MSEKLDLDNFQIRSLFTTKTWHVVSSVLIGVCIGLAFISIVLIATIRSRPSHFIVERIYERLGLDPSRLPPVDATKTY